MISVSSERMRTGSIVLGRRGLEPMAAGILDLDKTRRALITDLQELQERRNTASKEIGTIKQSGGDADALMQEGPRSNPG